MPRHKSPQVQELFVSRFVAAFIEHNLNATKAYIVAKGLEGESVSNGVASTLGSRMLGKVEVQEALEKACSEVKTTTVLSLGEKRAFLAGVVRAAPKDDSEESIYCQSQMSKMGPYVSGPSVSDKLKAIELDAKLAGELSGEDPNKERDVTPETKDAEAIARRDRLLRQMPGHGGKLLEG